MIIRSAKYSLKFATIKKKKLLEETFKLYKYYLQKTIDLMWKKKIWIKKSMSSKDIDWMGLLGGQYKQLIYKHASQIVRSARRRKKSKPEIKNLTVYFDEKFVKILPSNNSFDRWIKIRLPFIKEGKKRERIEILIPIKEHKHSLRFKDWKLKKTIMINLEKNWISLIFEKEEPIPKEEGKIIGIDLGYKNLITTSEGQFIGKDFDEIYKKISRKKQGSKAFKRVLIERNNKINELINKELDWKSIKIIKIEDLKNLKYKTKGKFRKEFNNKLQRFVYRQVIDKLERKAQEEAVRILRVPPAGTSITCPSCQFKHKRNRIADRFKCLNCGYVEHADIVAAINISNGEPIVPHAEKAFFQRVLWHY
jgi:IS605 OrfB family transposase